MKILYSLFFNIIASVLLILFLSCKTNSVDKIATNACLLEKFIYENGSEETFEHDSEDRLIKHIVYEKSIKRTSTRVYDYDLDGKVIKETEIFSDDVNNPFITEFKYNSKGLLIAIGTNCINLFYDQDDKLSYVTYEDGGIEYYSNDELIKKVDQNKITNILTYEKVGNYDVTTVTSKNYIAKYYYYDGNLFKKNIDDGSPTYLANYTYDAYIRPTIPSVSKKGWPIAFYKYHPPLKSISKHGTSCSDNYYRDLKSSKNNLIQETVNGKIVASYKYEYNKNDYPTVEIAERSYASSIPSEPIKYFYKNCQ